MVTNKEQILMELNQKGQRHLEAGELDEAKAAFQEHLELDDHPIPRNNVATILDMQGEHAEAFGFLEPTLEKGLFNPYARALACIILVKLDREGEAEEYLNEAIEQFDRGMKNSQSPLFYSTTFREYTVIIKRAAGALGADHLVLDLHKRWQKYYVTQEDHFQVGTAFFNIGYLEQAVKAWSRVTEDDWDFLQNYFSVADLIRDGLIPPFRLPYLRPALAEWDNYLNMEIAEKLLQGDFRAVILSNLFDPEVPLEFALELLRPLVSIDDEWSVEFARCLLDAATVPAEWKTLVAVMATCNYNQPTR